jgi:hypothetical protein
MLNTAEHCTALTVKYVTLWSAHAQRFTIEGGMGTVFECTKLCAKMSPTLTRCLTFHKVVGQHLLSVLAARILLLVSDLKSQLKGVPIVLQIPTWCYGLLLCIQSTPLDMILSQFHPPILLGLPCFRFPRGFTKIQYAFIFSQHSIYIPGPS